MEKPRFYLLCFQWSAGRPQAGDRNLCRALGGFVAGVKQGREICVEPFAREEMTRVKGAALNVDFSPDALTEWAFGRCAKCA